MTRFNIVIASMLLIALSFEKHTQIVLCNQWWT